MELLNTFVNHANHYLWGVFFLIPLLCGTGIFFTIRLRFVQVRYFGLAARYLFGGASLFGKKADQSGMSSFQALATAVAAQVGTGNAPVEYYGLKAAIGTENAQDVDSTDGTYFTKVDNATQGLVTSNKDGIPTTAYQQVLHLEKGVTKVRIYMWVEGQDVDCEDYASGGDLTYNLQFSSLSKQA